MDYLGDLQAFLPGIITAVAGLAVITIEALKSGHKSAYWVTSFSLIVALFLESSHWELHFRKHFQECWFTAELQLLVM